MKLQFVLVCFVALVSVSVREASGAKILALLSLLSPSHHIFNRELMIALANRGHDVTVISNDIDKEPVANLTYIHLEGTYEYMRSHMSYDEFTSEWMLDKLRLLRESVYSACEYQFSTNGAKLLLSYPNKKLFDLIIVESEYSQCFWSFISKFGYPPVVAMCGTGMPRRAQYMTGSPKNPAYTPDYVLPFTDKMDFLQRVESFVTDMFNLWKFNFEYFPTLQEIVDRHFGYKTPALEDYERNISLLLSNTVFGHDISRPIAPNVIPVGGMHLRPPKPLEQNLQKFLDDAKDGAIFFSLGTNLRSDLFPAHVQRAFLEVFADLPQRVLWKFESDDLPLKPRNVMIGKWLPQRDILGHKNIKLFITHNGKYSSQEALYFGVPTLGIPFFMDQQGNAEQSRELGIGISVPQASLNKEIIFRSINQLLKNASYAENAQRMSAAFRDQIDRPLDRAVFWTEYVLRHEGAPHLRTAAVDMPLFRYLLLDVLAALLAALVATALVLAAVARWLWRHARPAAKKAKIN